MTKEHNNYKPPPPFSQTLTPPPPLTLAAVSSKAVIMSLFIQCLLMHPLFVLEFCVWSGVCYAVLSVFFLVLQSSWRGRKRTCVLYFYCLHVVLWLLRFCGSFSRCRGAVSSVWLLFSLIILTFFNTRLLDVFNFWRVWVGSQLMHYKTFTSLD